MRVGNDNLIGIHQHHVPPLCPMQAGDGFLGGLGEFIRA